MANVAFKRGPQANLPASAVDGVFYLTSDTNRLYVGQGTNLVELNKSITVVATIDDLPTSDIANGQFYYVSGSNILCVYNGTQWVQINPDTNNDVYVRSATVEKVSSSDIEHYDPTKVTYKLSINQADKNRKTNEETSVASIVAYFDIIPSDVATAAVDVAASVTNGNAVISTSGVGAAGNGFAVVAGDNITIESDGSDGFEINGIGDTTYELSTKDSGDDALVTLTGSDDAETSAIFKAGTALSVDGSASGITYSHNASGVTAGTYGSSASTPTAGSSFNIPQIAVDAQGHITSASNQAITLPVDNDTKYKAYSASANNEGKITIAISEEDGSASTSATSGAVLYHTITVDGTENTVYNQNSLGSFWSATKTSAEIEKAKAEMDAMTYKGTVASAAAVSKTPNKGDTYKASADFTLHEDAVKVGDLIIYNGDDVDATHPYDVNNWDIVPSGNEDTTYTFGTEGVKLWDKSSTDDAKDYFAEFVGDSAEITASNASGKIKFSHATHAQGSAGANTAGALAYGGGFKVPKITTNAAGHITAIEDVTLTLPASDEADYSLAIKKNNSTNVPYLALMEDEVEKNTININGDSWVKAEQATGAINLSHANAGTASNTKGLASDVAPAHGGKFKVPYVGIDSKGHVSVLQEHEVTLPADLNTTYDFSGSISASDNVATITNTLTDSGSAQDNFIWKLKSNSLTITKEGNDTVVADLVWGSF